MKKIIFGCIFMFLSFLILIFFGGYLQSNLGVLGLFLSEIVLLLFALIFTKANNISLKDAFPLEKPTFKGIFGTFLMWGACYTVSVNLSSVMALIFPEQMLEVTHTLENALFHPSLIISLFVFAVTPAICEEALFRGFFISSLKALKSEWLIIAVSGLVFGIFHTNLIRFLPTAVLGCGLSLIMIKTKNFVYPVLFHFFNNALSTVLSHYMPRLSVDMQVANSFSAGETVLMIGIYVAFMTVSPLLFFISLRSLIFSKTKIPPRGFSGGILPYTLVSGLIMICGCALIMLGTALSFADKAVY